MIAALSLALASVVAMPAGKLDDGRAVERYVLTNARGHQVSLLTIGGAIDAIRMPDRHGRLANVVLALPSPADYAERTNFGSIVGRYANRISQGGFTIDGHRYALSPDPTATILHGGKDGFSERIWKAEPCRTAGCSAVTLRLTSPDGDGGFPGTLEVAVTYSLSADDTLRIDYRATTDKPTVVNLTNHSYFNLAGADSGSADGQTIQILASHYTPADEHRLPTGEFRSVAGTVFDLRTPVAIGTRVNRDDPQLRAAHGFDHNFVLDGPKGDTPALAAVAHDPASGRTLRLYTTEPGLQFYTANGFDGGMTGAAGTLLRQGAGFALETEHFPDSPHHPDFPTTVLRPGAVFHSTTLYRFGVDDAR